MVEGGPDPFQVQFWYCDCAVSSFPMLCPTPHTPPMGGSGPSQMLCPQAQQGWQVRSRCTPRAGPRLSGRLRRGQHQQGKDEGGCKQTFLGLGPSVSPQHKSKQFKLPLTAEIGEANPGWGFQLGFHITSLWNLGSDYKPTGEGPPTGPGTFHRSPTCGSMDVGLTRKLHLDEKDVNHRLRNSTVQQGRA